MARKGFGKSGMKKEKIALMAASGLVLTALTITGFYMRGQNEAEQDDGYTIDFQALEESVENKSHQIARNMQQEENIGENVARQEQDTSDVSYEKNKDIKPGKQSKNQPEKESVVSGDESQGETLPEGEDPGEAPVGEGTADSAVETGTPQVVNSPELSFAESEGLTRPLEGEVILPFSMDSSIYFTTLDQYKYNPAMIIAAEPGTDVVACADGQVRKICNTRENGQTVIIDLGNGYSMTYGQLTDVSVTEGSYIGEGSLIAKVAEPSIYYSAEGANLYLHLEKDGVPVNPEALFKQ